MRRTQRKRRTRRRQQRELRRLLTGRGRLMFSAESEPRLAALIRILGLHVTNIGGTVRVFRA